MHVVIAKPLRTLGSSPEGVLLRDVHEQAGAELLRARMLPIHVSITTQNEEDPYKGVAEG
ncbi:hypothetical protein MES4922_40276 [Mesorhizobium ventifaucium]|uniref:Uncharacterized protein n=1 Tax=Mesorhizobium ventifaucium TaxID=666020 RepID=A0ABN8K7A3_9HYPH|nr:hypothetical protein MES4922_40276 [Mesorhizobium ventifaucium]